MNLFSLEKAERTTEAAEVRHPPETARENPEQLLQPLREIGAVSNCREAVTRCDIEAIGKLMDYKQGVEINGKLVLGNCGLDSSRNLLALCGKKYSEEYITKYAIDHKLCAYSERIPPASRGGTTPEKRAELNRRFGVELETFFQERVNWNAVADKLEAGHRGILSLNAGIYWNRPEHVSLDEKGRPVSNHVVTLLGAVRDKQSGEVVGFYICDTGAAQKQSYTYISVDQLNKCCKGVRNACVQMTAKSYGEVKL